MEASTAYLTVIAPGDHPLSGQSFALADKSLLGSGKVPFQISGKSVNKNHCEIEFKQGVLMLKNLAATDVTKVQGHNVPQGRTIILQMEDVIELGEVQLKLSTRPIGVAQDTPTAIRELSLSDDQQDRKTSTSTDVKKLERKKAEEKKGPRFSMPSFFSRFKLKTNFSLKDLFKRKSVPKISYANGWFLERFVAVTVDFLVAAHIYYALLSTDIVQTEMEKFEQVVLLDMASSLSKIEQIPPMDPALLVGMFWCWLIYIFWRLITTVIFGVSFGQLVSGLQGHAGIIWNRVGGVVRVILEGLSSMLLIGDLPALFGVRTLKELLSSTRIVRRSWALVPVGMALSVILAAGLAVAPSFWYQSLFVEMSLSAETFGAPKGASGEEKVSKRFKMTVPWPEEKTFVFIPNFQVIEGRGKKTIRPELFVYDFARFQSMSFQTDQEFDLGQWITRMTRGQFFYPIVYPELMNTLAAGKNISAPYAPFSKNLQGEIKTMMEWALNQNPMKLLEEGAPLHPLMAAGYAQGLSYFDQNIRGSSLAKMSWSQMGKWRVLLLYRKGMKEQKVEILPMGSFKSQRYELTYAKEGGGDALKAFIRDFLGRAQFDFSPTNKDKLAENRPLNVFSLIDEFAEKKLDEGRRKEVLKYITDLYKTLGSQYFAQKDANPQLATSFHPLLVESVDNTLMVIQLTSGEWSGDFSELVTELLKLKQALSAQDASFFPAPIVEEVAVPSEPPTKVEP